MQFDNYRIRQLTTGDLEDYYKMVDKNRSRLEDFFTGTVSRTKTFSDAEVFLSEILNLAEKKQYFPYVLVDEKKNSIIGFFDLKNIDWSVPKSEMGAYVDADYTGKGITTKAFSLFCDYCFQELGFKKLFFRTHESNTPVHKIAEKCGFQVEGTLRKDYKTTSGQLIDLIYYGRIG